MQSNRALITGGNSGIGKQTAIGLARQGYEVVIACRDDQKAEAACRDIRGAVPNARITSMRLDLGSLKSIRAFASAFFKQYPTLDLLINNAGVMPMTRETTSDGFEKNMGTNHLGHFLLTMLLLPSLRAAPQARIVVVGSDAQFKGQLDFSNLESETGYHWIKAYANSKLANMSFTLALARRLVKTNITVACLHPGMTRTNIWPRANFSQRLFSKAMGWFAIPDTQAAGHVLQVATAPELQNVSGKYYDRGQLKEPATAAADTTVQEQLWKWSEARTGCAGEYTFA
ncbi:MAG TPA: SDR family oxidoreductase [Candidatus Limnocylindria bacterium]|jgi:NAD(P)-dependent dehydrogenase (short-subunit alcohol dehydrogenase family)|nr:SDR family oxidoreductase [Candidatus Limnocylindria bacterium]